MADYTILEPASLDGLDRTTPAASEDASKLDDAIRQVKAIVIDVLTKEHNADGGHKSVHAALDPNSITGDKINHSSSDDSKRAISTDHIKDGSVTEPKLSIQSISGEKLKDGSIAGSKIQPQAIGAAHIQPNSLTPNLFSGGSPITPGSVGTSAIADGAVTTAKVADGAIDAAKMSLADTLIPIGAGTEVVAAQVGGVLELSSVDQTTSPPTAVFRILAGGGTLLPIVFVQEVGSTGGSASAQTWNRRPKAPAVFSKAYDGGQLVTLQGQSIIFRDKGTYLVMGQATAYKTEGHQLRLRDITNNRTLIVGTYGDANVASNSQTTSAFFGTMELVADDTEIVIEHYTVVANGTDGLGKAAGSNNGEPQVFMQLVAIKLN